MMVSVLEFQNPKKSEIHSALEVTVVTQRVPKASEINELDQGLYRTPKNFDLRQVWAKLQLSKVDRKSGIFRIWGLDCMQYPGFQWKFVQKLTKNIEEDGNYSIQEQTERDLST